MGEGELTELFEDRVQCRVCPCIQGCAGCAADRVRDDDSARIRKE